MSKSYNEYFFTRTFPLHEGYICAVHLENLRSLSLSRQRAIHAFAVHFRHPALARGSESRMWMNTVGTSRKSKADALDKIAAFTRRINQVQGSLCVDEHGTLRGRVGKDVVFGGDNSHHYLFGCPSNAVPLADRELVVPDDLPLYMQHWVVVYNSLMLPSQYAKGKQTTLRAATDKNTTALLEGDDGTVYDLGDDPIAFYAKATEAWEQNMYDTPLTAKGARLKEMLPEHEMLIAELDDNVSMLEAVRTNSEVASMLYSFVSAARNVAADTPGYRTAKPLPAMLDRKVPFGGKIKQLLTLLYSPTADKGAVYATAQHFSASCRAMVKTHDLVDGVNRIKGKRIS